MKEFPGLNPDKFWDIKLFFMKKESNVLDNSLLKFLHKSERERPEDIFVLTVYLFLFGVGGGAFNMRILTISFDFPWI